jgi:hypothetical protein
VAPTFIQLHQEVAHQDIVLVITSTGKLFLLLKEIKKFSCMGKRQSYTEET